MWFASKKSDSDNTAAQEQDKQEVTSKWTPEAEQELQKIPFFVRSRAKRNTEIYSSERGISPITVEALYEAREHFGNSKN